MKLLSWVNSIENGPDWNEILGGPAPWGFTITCDLSKDVTTADKLELSFRITRYGSVWSHADESAHVMTLKILPVKSESDDLFLICFIDVISFVYFA